MKKNIIIVLFIVIVIIILILFGYFILTRDKDIESKSNDNIINVVNDNGDDKENVQVIPEDDKIEGVENKDNKQENNDNNNRLTNNNNNQTNNNNNQNTNQVVPQITYSCPNGYTLDGIKCTSVIDANHVCPDGTVDYSSANISPDTYCVNLSEGYEIDTDDCPDNYGSVAVIGFGTPTVYHCLPLHEKIYTCQDEYSLDGTKCIKTIDASVN